MPLKSKQTLTRLPTVKLGYYDILSELRRNWKRLTKTANTVTGKPVILKRHHDSYKTGQLEFVGETSTGVIFTFTLNIWYSQEFTENGVIFKPSHEISYIMDTLNYR